MNTVAERSGLKFYCRPECDPARVDESDRRHVREAPRRGPHRADPLRHGRRPVARGNAADHARSSSRPAPTCIELGVPFSDPMADGPVIQRASERALAQGVGLADVLAIVAEFRKADTATPVVLMGYANPIEAMGTASVRGARARRPASTACWSSTIRRRRPAEFAALLGARGARADLPAVADDARGAHRHDRRDRARLRLLRVAQGRDRRRPSRHRRGRAQARRDPPARRAAGRRGLRHSRRGERAGDRGATPTRSSSAAASSRKSRPARRTRQRSAPARGSPASAARSTRRRSAPRSAADERAPSRNCVSGKKR